MLSKKAQWVTIRYEIPISTHVNRLIHFAGTADIWPLFWRGIVYFHIHLQQIKAAVVSLVFSFVLLQGHVTAQQGVLAVEREYFLEIGKLTVQEHNIGASLAGVGIGMDKLEGNGRLRSDSVAKV